MSVVRSDRYSRALAEGRQALGVFCCLDGFAVAQIFAAAGFDFVVIDKQHAAFTWPDLENLCLRIRATDAAVFLRVASIEAAELDLALDLPVTGVVLPGVSSVEEARIAVERCKLPPAGVRSIGNQRHEAMLGVARGPEPLVGLLIEHTNAVAAIDAILALGVDFVWVGLHDLAGSFGFDPGAGDPRQGIRPPVRAALERVRGAARDRAVPFWGIAGLHPDAAAVLAGVDARLVRRVADDAIAQFRAGELKQLPGRSSRVDDVAVQKRVFVSAKLQNPFAAKVLSMMIAPLAAEIELVLGGDLHDEARARALTRAHAFFGLPSREELGLAERLEVVAIPGSGVETVDLALLSTRCIAVVNAAGAQHDSVAEHAIALMLALVKRIALSDRWFRGERKFPERGRYVGVGFPHGYPTELEGKTIGIVGYGFAGRALAEKCRLAFHMRILAHDPYQDAGQGASPTPLVVGSDVTLVPELSAMLSECDFVSLHLPLTDETRGRIAEGELRAMKPSAYLIDLSRGGIVDQVALLRALREGWIAGAGLDVFDPEPLPDDHPLFSLDNVVLTPHIGGWTVEALPRLARVAADAMLAVLRGERPDRLVNAEIWPEWLARRRASSSS